LASQKGAVPPKGEGSGLAGVAVALPERIAAEFAKARAEWREMSDDLRAAVASVGLETARLLSEMRSQLGQGATLSGALDGMRHKLRSIGECVSEVCGAVRGDAAKASASFRHARAGYDTALNSTPIAGLDDVWARTREPEAIARKANATVLTETGPTDVTTLLVSDAGEASIRGATQRMGFRPVQISVRPETGGNMELSVESTDWVKDVKEKIQELSGIPRDEQILFLGRRQLEDYQTLGDYSIGEGSALELTSRADCKMVRLLVLSPAGTCIMLEAKPTDTLDVVRERIEANERILLTGQVLLFAGKRLEGGKTLSDYSIADNSALELVPSLSGCESFGAMSLTVLFGTRKFTVPEVKPTNTIGDLKVKIGSVEGIAPDCHHLVFANEPLEDGKLLRDYSIVDGSTLRMVACPPARGGEAAGF
jgi:ubiquitin C